MQIDVVLNFANTNNSDNSTSKMQSSSSSLSSNVTAKTEGSRHQRRQTYAASTPTSSSTNRNSSTNSDLPYDDNNKKKQNVDVGMDTDTGFKHNKDKTSTDRNPAMTTTVAEPPAATLDRERNQNSGITSSSGVVVDLLEEEGREKQEVAVLQKVEQDSDDEDSDSD